MTPLPLQITCKEFVELVTLYLEGALREEDRARFEAHRERCPGCQAYLQQFRITIEAISLTDQLPNKPDNLDELLDTYRKSGSEDPDV